MGKNSTAIFTGVYRLQDIVAWNAAQRKQTKQDTKAKWFSQRDLGWEGPSNFQFQYLGGCSLLSIPLLEGSFDSFTHLWVSLAIQRDRKTTVLSKQPPKHQCQRDWHTPPYITQVRIPLPFPLTSGAIQVIKTNFRLLWHCLRKEVQRVSVNRVSSLLYQTVYYPTLQTGNGGTGELQGHTGSLQLSWK